jgi:serine/threonine protein kinase
MMKSKTSRSSGPFSKVITEEIMWLVAKGMDWLHSRNIVHRDLKASNVLVGKDEKSILVADFECSVGVVGTGFFRAPEILQACKDKTINHRPELFTKAVDVYSYGMTCYEILTGKLPFEGHLQNDYDLVLSGCRPEVPKYVDGWILELLSSCWQADPIARPSFAEILNLLISSSTIARKINKASIESEEERLRLFQVKLSKRNSQFLGFLL